MSEGSIEFFSFESSSSENLADLSALSSPAFVPERPSLPLQQQLQERYQYQSLPGLEERLARSQQVGHLPDVQQLQLSHTGNHQVDPQQRQQWQVPARHPSNVESENRVLSNDNSSRRREWSLAQPQQQRREPGYLRQLQRHRQPEDSTIEHEQQLNFQQQPSMQQRRYRGHALNSFRTAAHSASFQPSLTPNSSPATVEVENHNRQNRSNYTSSVPLGALVSPTSSFSSSGGVAADSEISYISTLQPQSIDKAFPGALASATTTQQVSHAGSAVRLVPYHTAEQTSLPYRCFSDTEAVLKCRERSPELSKFGTPTPSPASSLGNFSVVEQGSPQQQQTLLRHPSETLRSRANTQPACVGPRRRLRSTEKAEAAFFPLAAAAPLFPSTTVTATRPALAAENPPLLPKKTRAPASIGLARAPVLSSYRLSPSSTNAEPSLAGADLSAAAKNESSRGLSEGQRVLLRDLLWPSEPSVEDAEALTQEQQQLSGEERNPLLFPKFSAHSGKAFTAAAQARDLLLTAESPADSSVLHSHSGAEAAAGSSSGGFPSIISSSSSVSQFHGSSSSAAADPQQHILREGVPPRALVCSQQTTVAPSGAVRSHAEGQRVAASAHEASADVNAVKLFSAFPSSSQRELGTTIITAPSVAAAAAVAPVAGATAGVQWSLVDPISKARQEAAIGDIPAADERSCFSHRAAATSRAYAAPAIAATPSHLFASTPLPPEKPSTEKIPIRAAFSSPAVFCSSTPPLQTMPQPQHRLLQQPQQQQALHTARAPVPLESLEPPAAGPLSAQFPVAAAAPFPVQQQLQHAQSQKPVPGAYQSRKWVAETVYRPVDVVTRTVEIPLVRHVDIFVRRPIIKEKVVEIPKLVPHYVEKIVEVPEVHWVDKVVEVPEVLYKTRLVPKTEIRENIIEQPFIEEQWIEKYVEVPRVEEIVRFQEVVEIEDVIKYIPKNHSEEEWRGAPIYSIPPEHAPPLPPKLPGAPVDDFIYKTPAAGVGAAAGFPNRLAAAAESTAYKKPIAPQQYPSRATTDHFSFFGQHLSENQAEHAASSAVNTFNGMRPGEQVTFH